MANIALVSFERLDYSIPSHIEEISKEFADLFKIRRDYVSEYCSLIKTSKRWDMSNVSDKLDKWITKMQRYTGVRKFLEITKRAFESCTSKEEIDSLRGAMMEALVIGSFGGSENLGKDNYGWGARVDINIPNTPVEKVRYKCTLHQETDCSNRSTVDFGYWNGSHGKFYECKVQPMGIGCKEVKYMQHLKDRLGQHQISNEMFFVCADPTEEIKIKLTSLGLGPLYKAIGIQELTQMLKAS